RSCPTRSVPPPGKVGHRRAPLHRRRAENSRRPARTSTCTAARSPRAARSCRFRSLWLQLAESSAGGQYCSDRTPPCWDDNHANQGNIGHVATLLLDVFDGQGAARDANVATNADAWL